MTLEEAIEQKIGEVRIDALDLSFGELISLYMNNEFTISPDFQRFFRWSNSQRSRLIESVLLELPIPQIFVIETKDGILELIDGLQRISSVIQFVQPEVLSLDSLKLDGCDLIPLLNGKSFGDLPLALRLRIKRASVRAVVIKRQSTTTLRYEMFKRLNTGGSALSEQEVRNCNARMAGKRGIQFYDFLRDCASVPSFSTCTSTLSESDREKKADEELVLRYLALKNGRELFRGSVCDWLDAYMEREILRKPSFRRSEEKEQFTRLFDYLARIMGESTFVRFRGKSPVGGLAPAYFEAVTLGVWRVLDELESVDDDVVRDTLITTVQSVTFRSFVGSGSNSLAKFNGRIDTVEEAFRKVLS